MLTTRADHLWIINGPSNMNRDKRVEIFTRLRDANPTPTTELRYSSTFELLIAVILSAQATDLSVSCRIDKHVRGWEKPSDHVPVIVELDI